jgi:hypothetical protein
MLDTYYSRIDEIIADDFLKGTYLGRTFQHHNFLVRTKTLKRGSPYEKKGASFMIDLDDPKKGVTFSGPVFASRQRIHLTGLRVSAPRCLGLSPGSLPTTDGQLQQLSREIMSVSSALGLGPNWLDAARVIELHVTMNFGIPFDYLVKHHVAMRHPRVRKDPMKYRPSHRSLYWTGSSLGIVIYDKTRELLSKPPYKHREGETPVRLPELTRLEFRLKQPAILRELARMDAATTTQVSYSAMPPSRLAPKGITAALLLDIFRSLVGEFPSQPKRNPKRLTVATFAGMLHHRGVEVEGTPILDYYSQFANDRNVSNARRLSATAEAGGVAYCWKSLMAGGAWGPFARPEVRPLQR